MYENIKILFDIMLYIVDNIILKYMTFLICKFDPVSITARGTGLEKKGFTI